MPRWLLGAGLAVALLAAIGAGARWWIEGRPITVQTAAALAPDAASAAGGPAVLLQATGYVTARRQATVSTQITGTLTEVLIEEGDHVERGQVLARLEDSALKASLSLAQANIATAEAQVAEARAQLHQAEADEKRLGELVASGMLSKQAGDQTRTTVVTSAATLDARSRAAEAAQAQLRAAQVNFGYSVLRAPFSGVVTVKAAQVGEIVSPLSAGGGFTRTGVGTIVDMDSLEVEVDVNEASISQVRAGMACEAVLDAYPDWRIPSKVIAVIPSADRGKATVKVRVALEQKDARLVPEMGARVSFLGGTPAKPAAAAAPATGALVPKEAVVEQAGASVVFVLAGAEGSRVQRRAVAPQDRGAMRLLPTGVQPGERVVLSPPPSLRDGAAVADERRVP